MNKYNNENDIMVWNNNGESYAFITQRALEEYVSVLKHPVKEYPFEGYCSFHLQRFE